MKTPIILRSDDGISWFTTKSDLEISVESPDIEDGIYTTWDADGQILALTSLEPVRHTSFLGLKTVSISSGKITETGRYDVDGLQSLIALHIQQTLKYQDEIPADLHSIVTLLCQLEPAAR